jgi:hypothetical protein
MSQIAFIAAPLEKKSEQSMKTVTYLKIVFSEKVNHQKIATGFKFRFLKLI